MNRIAIVAGFSLAVCAIIFTAVAGPINPPTGPVASTNKTLQQVYDTAAAVESRTAINVANTPGDATSLFKISQPGSYYLTGNIAGVSAKRGIAVAASGVTIDLNGFALTGVAGSLDGIATTASTLDTISIRNGSLRSWGGSGIDMATLSVPATGVTISGVTSSGNGSRGMYVGAGIVSGCTANGNVGAGIAFSGSALITGCSASNNGGDGITASSSTITTCAANANLGNGILGGGGSTITNCHVTGSGLDGIRVFFECTVLSNSCRLSGQNAADGAGIHVLNSSNRVEGNTCTSADFGIKADSGFNIILRNACSNSSIANWNIVASNVVGPILDRTAPASAAINGNSAPSSLGSTDANANFTY